MDTFLLKYILVLTNFLLKFVFIILSRSELMV